MKIFLMILIIGTSNFIYADFTKKNGVITDSFTKLEWQDDYSDNGGDIKRTTWQDAIDYCETLNLDGRGWKLPNIRELESLVDDSKYNPSINSVFEFISSSYYWSSTTYAYYSGNAWFVNFNDGNVYCNYENRSNNLYVRCVRAGE